MREVNRQAFPYVLVLSETNLLCGRFIARNALTLLQTHTQQM